MTFYEAALQILLREGRPLHANEITEIALKENLLSHVGKQPEVVMASRLAAMARRSHDRRLVAVEPDTFALVDWNVTPDPEALRQSGQPPEPEEEEPLRGRERHPKISKEKVRIAGRGERRRKEEVERRRRRSLSLPSIVADVLERMQVPVPLFDLASLIRESDLVTDDLGREALANQLRAENARREEEGEDTLFTFPDGGMVGLYGWPPTTPEMFEVAPPLEEVVSQVAAERRPRVPAAPAPAAASPTERLQAEHRQQAIRALRKRLLELDGPGLEAVTQCLLESMGYRGTRVAKRHKEGALFTTRRRMGLVEVRFAIRVLRGGREVRREDVAELRKDLNSHSAQVGVLVSPADPTREARSEASRPGQSLILLLCADALADQLAERGIGVSRQTVTLDFYDPEALEGLIGGQGGKGRGREERERRPREEREKKERRSRREERKAAEAARGTAEDEAAEAKEAPAAEERAEVKAAEDAAARTLEAVAEAIASPPAASPAGGPEGEEVAASAEKAAEPAAPEGEVAPASAAPAARAEERAASEGEGKEPPAAAEPPPENPLASARADEGEKEGANPSEESASAVGSEVPPAEREGEASGGASAAREAPAAEASSEAAAGGAPAAKPIPE